MKLNRILGISLAIGALIVAAITTILQVQPALFFIELLTNQGKFPITLVFLLTALIFLLPVFIVVILVAQLRKPKNVIPDLVGKTGVLLNRKRALYNAAYIFKILVDGEEVGKLGNGQKIFVVLHPGLHSIKIEGFELSNFEFQLSNQEVKQLKTEVRESRYKAEIRIVEEEALIK